MDHKHGEGCGCSHETKTENMAVLYNLYSKIEKENLECLNESQEGAGKLVFRPWDERLLKDKVCLERFLHFYAHIYIQCVIQLIYQMYFSYSLWKVMLMRSYCSTFREYIFSLKTSAKFTLCTVVQINTQNS